MNGSQWLEVALSYFVQVSLLLAVAYGLDRRVVVARVRNSIWSTFYWSVLLLGIHAILFPRFHFLLPRAQLSSDTALSVAVTQSLIGRLLLLLWAAGAGVVLCRWLVSGYKLQRILGRCSELPAAEARKILGLGRMPIPGGSTPRMLISDDVESPFCWQFHQPTMVLPRFVVEGPQEDLMHVVIHELEHLRTHHPLQLFLQHAVEVLCWCHPAIWRASRRASLVREFVCDDATLALGTNTGAYLRTLLRIAERSGKHSTALAFGRNCSEVIIRSRRIASASADDRSTVGPWRRWNAIIGVVLVATLISQLWLPIDVLASSRSKWSPWPTWTATTLHCFGVTARDYEIFDHGGSIHELREDRRERTEARHEKQKN